MGNCSSVPKTKKTHRKQASTSIQSDFLLELKIGTAKEKVPNKSSKILIEGALKKHYLFSDIFDEDLDFIMNSLIFFSISAEEYVFKQGEIGSTFFIVESGKLEVIRNGIKKTVLQSGDYFGDMSLLTDFPRRASIKTLEYSELWGIGREAFRELIYRINKRSLSEIQAFISQLKTFSSLPDYQIKELANVSVQHRFKDNMRIICEGDEGVLLYIIKEGKAVAKFQGIEKFRLIAGEIFGEAEVFGDDNIRKYSVYSVGDTRVLSLSTHSINKILGENFREIIFKNQARNTLLSSKFTKHLSRDSINHIIEACEWKKLKPDDDALESPIDKAKVYILCMGALKSEKAIYEDHKVIGFIEKKRDKTLVDITLSAITESMIGIISLIQIEVITKMHWHDLRRQLKNIHVLKKIEFLSVLSNSKLRYMSSVAKRQSFEKKEVIFRCGEAAKTIFVILSGKVKIYYHGKKLRVLGKYEIFGDNCLQEKSRSVNAKAVRKSKCIVINDEDILDIMDNETRYKVKKTKSFLSHFKLYELLLVKQVGKTEEKDAFLSFVNDIQCFFYVETIKKEKVTTKETFKQLLNEKNIAISIEHPQIIRLAKTFSDSLFIYIVYENFMVSDFSGILNIPLIEEHAKFLAASLLSILEYLHEKNIIYREFNPITLSLGNNGYPFISNLRSAKVVKDRTKTRLEVNPYTAPEMIIAEGYNKSVNFWNLGVMIYQFLYNALPFDLNKIDSPFDMYNKILKGELIFPIDSKYIRANELINHLLKKDLGTRAGLNDAKYSRWLDAIDWQRVKNLEYESPFKPQIVFQRQTNLSKCTSLTRHVHEMNKLENEQGQKPKKSNKRMNWDKFF
ncbi:hypothetical protein SteCoe_14867 [Stentor coeruleus]|uniref:cGMP-dependent protein kinase n=1 Tax=Stentor coeruleus TaxID=5963 RepID=A0A1R2C4X1_9CILI|nr:hypothetical protein SteCoe_14867 [Stentor coeruleus]